VLKPFKQSVGFQEKHAVATLHRSKMRLPCVTELYNLTFYILSSNFYINILHILVISPSQTARHTFFLQYYNIPTRNDIIKLMDKIDRLEMLIKSSLINGKGAAISGIQVSKSKTSTGRSALEVIKRFRKGVGFADIQARTGFEDKKLRNIIYRLHKTGKIVRKSRGLYIAA